MPLGDVADVAGIGAEIDVRNAIDDDAVGNRRHADRDIQAVDERAHFGRMAMFIDAVDDGHGVAALRARLGGKRIFDRLREIEPAAGIEIQIDRLANFRLGGDQLDLEAGRQMKLFKLLGRRKWRGVDDIGIGVRRVRLADRARVKLARRREYVE